ncbi:MAG: retropepsin-like aspartic protease [Wenzhouxiangellaceae bacterium]|nr:retropepsin-like aspartic protease [Wenzhouxiangellaceae bacterium]
MHYRIGQALLGILVFLIAADSGAQTMDDVVDEQGWMRFDGASGHITFPVKVNDTPASAIFDTGADVSMISAALAERAGIELNQHDRIRVSGVHGRREIPSTKRFTLEFAGRSVKVNSVPALPSPVFDVVLGRGLFERAVVQIDYPNHRIRILNRGDVDFEGNVKLRTTHRSAPMVEARVLGEKAWLLFDTGNASATVLKRRFVRRHKLDRFEAQGVAASGSGVITAGEQRLLQIPGFELGPYEFESLVAAYNAESNDGFDARARQPSSWMRTDRARYDGILGYEVLRNFVVTMDLKGRRMHLYAP